MITSELHGKKIIFFSVKTFNLEIIIKSKLESFGAKVYYFDERPSNSILVKGIIRVKRKYYQKRINAYYKNILNMTSKDNFDFLFVNRGEVIPEFFLEIFKSKHKDCKLIFYTWDSIQNQSHPIKILKYFDRKFTFDHVDAINYNMDFRPLFYSDAYKNKINKSNLKYDLVFIGTAHSDRYILSQKILKWCDANNLKTYMFYFIQSRIVFLYKYFFDKSFQYINYKNLRFKSVDTNEIIKIYLDSNVILDINHPNQKGLTMRTFEAIGLQKKLITTNKEIKKYKFYNDSNVCVIDRDNIIIDVNFFKNPYKPISDEMYNFCSLESWIDCIFFKNQSNFWIHN